MTKLTHSKSTLTNVTWSELGSDPTLPRTRTAKCQKCGNKEAVLVQTGFGARGNQPMTLWFVCTKCSHRWKDK